MANAPLVQISIRGGSVAVISGQVFAAMVPPPNAATWIASAADNGTIRFTDQASGLVLSAGDTEPGTQAIIAPFDAGFRVTSWLVTQFSDLEEDDPVQVKDPGQLTSGFYAIQVPSTGGYLFRNQVEDRSLMPKRVALQAADQDQGPLIIQVVG